MNETAGLTDGASLVSTLNVSGGTLIEGTHLIRVEVSPPAGGEITTANNATSTVLQVGTPTVSGATIVVSGSATARCASNGSIAVDLGGRADYWLVDENGALSSFPVQGGDVTFRVYDATGTTLIDTISEVTHTRTTGSFSFRALGSAQGDYIVRADVTDFSVSGTSADIPLTVPSELHVHIVTAVTADAARAELRPGGLRRRHHVPRIGLHHAALG